MKYRTLILLIFLLSCNNTETDSYTEEERKIYNCIKDSESEAVILFSKINNYLYEKKYLNKKSESYYYLINQIKTNRIRIEPYQFWNSGKHPLEFFSIYRASQIHNCFDGYEEPLLENLLIEPGRAKITDKEIEIISEKAINNELYNFFYFWYVWYLMLIYD